MRLKAFLFLVAIILTGLSSQAQSKISTRLQSELDTRGATNEYISISILLSDRVDIESLDAYLYSVNASSQLRATTVINELQQKAAETQGPLLNALFSSSEVKAASIKKFWISNAVFVEVKAGYIWHLAERNDVAMIDLNPMIENEEAIIEHSSEMRSFGGHEPGADAINAPAMWALGYTGYGRTAMGIDTGVNPDHQA